MSPLAEKTLMVAGTQQGVQEEPRGSNWGPRVQAYLSSVGLTFPAPWCMAFVYWCVQQGAAQLALPNPLLPTGSVMDQWHRISPVHKTPSPQVGDVFIMEFAHGTGHTGLVTAVKGDQIHTIEGNSNEDGSREGFEVCRHWRAISSLHGFIRL